MMISGFYIALHGILLVVLSGLVIFDRARYKVMFGEGHRPELKRAIRIQANFVEYVPLALIALVALELNQVSTLWLHGLGATLLAGRLLHAVGLGLSESTTVARFLGTVLTYGVILLSSLLLLLKWQPY